MPALFLTREQQEQAAALQNVVGPAAQQAMAEFVTGDTPLNDETWAAFKSMLTENGMNELTALWQSWID